MKCEQAKLQVQALLDNEIEEQQTSSMFGKILFFGSYALLFGYALFSLFSDRNTEGIIKIGIGGILLGFAVLLGITVANRIRESKDDRYKGVMK